MYQVLYRKWRPHTFDDVVGQEHITTTLKNEISVGKQSHSYLFTGTRGTGKTTCAKIVAKAVNCPNQKHGNPCNICELCIGIDNGRVLDVDEIDAASNNSVDDIRKLREEAYFLPIEAKYRVYILDEVHMLSASASNALLKIMEEPPAHVIFILATTEIHKVLPTILSRCQRFDFKRISTDVIVKQLQKIADPEEFKLQGEAAELIARLADGGMRDAISLLDVIASQCKEITYEVVACTVGIVKQDYLFRISQAVVNNTPEQAFLAIQDLGEFSVDYERLCEQLITHYRNLMIVKTTKSPSCLVLTTPEDLKKLTVASAEMNIQNILFAIDILQDTLGRMMRSLFKRAELEMAILKVCEKTHLAPIQPVAPPSAVKQKKTTPISPPIAHSSENTPANKDKNLEKEVVPFERWAEVLTVLKRSNGALYGTLENSSAYENGEFLLIDAPNETFISLVRENKITKTTLREAILQVTGKKYNLGPYDADKFNVKKDLADPLEQFLDTVDVQTTPIIIQ